MDTYLILLRPPREGFAENATPAEAAVIGKHFEYLSKLHAEGTMKIVGRTDESTPTGIALFQAPSLEAARKILREDPAVSAGIFRGEVKPFRLALGRFAD